METVTGHIQDRHPGPDPILGLVHVVHIRGHIQEVVLEVGHGIIVVDLEVHLEDEGLVPEVDQEAIQRKDQESTHLPIVDQNLPVIQRLKINKDKRR